MTGPPLPELCPLCSTQLATPSMDALEQHLPSCAATEARATDKTAKASAPAGPSKWLRKRRS
jgi:hypothetical protein